MDRLVISSSDIKDGVPLFQNKYFLGVISDIFLKNIN